MKTLRLHPHLLANIDRLVYPDDFSQLQLSSSALEIFTDFSANKPLVIEADTTAEDAEKLMQKTHVSLRLVINQQNEFIGVLGSADLVGEVFAKRIGQGSRKAELTVKDLMRARSELMALDYDELSRSTVDDVTTLLKRDGLQHCLVVDDKHHHIRGIISASDIARRLHIAVPITKIATSFAEVFEALNH